MSAPVYVRLAAVFAAAMLAIWLAPVSDWVQGMLAVPAVASLLGALLQISRDAVQFERQKHLQIDQQIFTLGAGSHMSMVAFDKHVAFCEAYMREVHETVGTLFREGPTGEAMGCAQKLFGLKREFSAWVPKSMALKLEPFENAVHQIGVQTHLVSALRGENREARSRAIDESYALFSNIFDLGKMKDTDPEHKQEIALENVKEQVRAILGINELVEIRNFIIQRSADYARKNA